MGTNKLLLPFRGTTLLEHVLSQWTASRVDDTLVVLNHEDQTAIEKCELADVICIVPETVPIEMKHSVQVALQWIDQHRAPMRTDAWLLAPADLPGLSSRIIDLVMDAYDPLDPAIIVPRHEQKRGHPAMFPWSCTRDVFRLENHQGVNSLLDGNTVNYVVVDKSGILQDVDTPDDYGKINR